MPNAIPGKPWPLYFDMYNQELGTLTDPDGPITLVITYGGLPGTVPDVAGPFSYSGASTTSSTQIWRISTGQYAFSWPVPANSVAGVYTATWTASFQGDTYPAWEDFYVAGAQVPSAASGDLGYWTGGLIYDDAGIDIEFGQVDANGIAWLWNRIEGWDSPDVQGGGVIPKSGDHGAWAAPQYYAARQLTLTVTASAPTQALRDTARAVLQQAVPVSDLAVLRYDEPVPKQALVRRSGKIAEKYPTLADVEFTIGLVAPDPRKYSTQVQTAAVNAVPSAGGGFTVPAIVPFTLPVVTPGGTVSVTNSGTFETEPVITVTGPVTSPALVNVTTGQAVSWTGLTVPRGQQLTVDFSLRQGLLGGAYRPADPASSWWALPPGVSVVTIQGQQDTGAVMQIQWVSAYM